MAFQFFYIHWNLVLDVYKRQVYYFAPDTNEWESLEIYYTQFVNWLINNPNGVNKFYECFRWVNWKEDCSKIQLNDGYSFYPLLQVNTDINHRSRKVVSIDELIRCLLYTSPS